MVWPNTLLQNSSDDVTCLSSRHRKACLVGRHTAGGLPALCIAVGVHKTPQDSWSHLGCPVKCRDLSWAHCTRQPWKATWPHLMQALHRASWWMHGTQTAAHPCTGLLTRAMSRSGLHTMTSICPDYQSARQSPTRSCSALGFSLSMVAPDPCTYLGLASRFMPDSCRFLHWAIGKGHFQGRPLAFQPVSQQKHFLHPISVSFMPSSCKSLDPACQYDALWIPQHKRSEWRAAWWREAELVVETLGTDSPMQGAVKSCLA